MKEIKFRVWGTDDLGFPKRMWYSNGLTVSYFFQNFVEQFQSTKLMQFTGLKDKNEKEIYEGDIVREHFNNQIYEIRENRSYYTAEGRGYRFPLFSIQYPLEVIGNIYENPDLLTATPQPSA